MLNHELPVLMLPDGHVNEVICLANSPIRLITVLFEQAPGDAIVAEAVKRMERRDFTPINSIQWSGATSPHDQNLSAVWRRIRTCRGCSGHLVPRASSAHSRNGGQKVAATTCEQAGSGSGKFYEVCPVFCTLQLYFARPSGRLLDTNYL
jgi:hypothetical protein